MGNCSFLSSGDSFDDDDEEDDDGVDDDDDDGDDDDRVKTYMYCTCM